MLEDLVGHRWELTETVRDVEPEEWGGATIRALVRRTEWRASVKVAAAETSRLLDVPRVSDVSVERLDVVAIGVNEKCCVVAWTVVAVTGRAVGAEAGVDTSSVEVVDFLA